MDTIQLALDLAFLGDATNENYSVVTFGFAAAMFGLLIVMLDFCTSKATEKNSLLKLSYSGYAGFWIFLLWGIGAGIAGLVGAAADIFEISRTASVFVGAGWPVILPRLLASANQDLSRERVPTE
ncbi:hypothetical protein CKQ84_07540 [Shewanella sp. WE21]|uniref:hypothetical protein n=1 Tax=Shewanella sp. WE21 TaxID=2029986 RepID=UPI000CF71A40|nr:hypothetical protein [Shewanella sp. WE21]AVI65757.1 hypothetical protein CKQ84_07540 [Shewanella sp. WE21]